MNVTVPVRDGTMLFDPLTAQLRCRCGSGVFESKVCSGIKLVCQACHAAFQVTQTPLSEVQDHFDRALKAFMLVLQHTGPVTIDKETIAKMKFAGCRIDIDPAQDGMSVTYRLVRNPVTDASPEIPGKGEEDAKAGVGPSDGPVPVRPGEGIQRG